MADTNTTTQQPGTTPREGMTSMKFTSVDGLYALVGSKGNMRDQISARLSHLEAMLAVIDAPVPSRETLRTRAFHARMDAIMGGK